MTITNYYFLYLVVTEACLTHLFLESKYFFGIVSILGIFWNAKLRYKWQYLGFLHGYRSLKPTIMTALRPLGISLKQMFSILFFIECCNILLKHIKKNFIKKKKYLSNREHLISGFFGLICILTIINRNGRNVHVLAILI